MLTTEDRGSDGSASVLSRDAGGGGTFNGGYLYTYSFVLAIGSLQYGALNLTPRLFNWCIELH